MQQLRAVTGQFADKPTHGQSTYGLVNSPKCSIKNFLLKNR